MINNSGRFKKGLIPWNKGKKYPELSGISHQGWKGGKSRYPSCWCGKQLSRTSAKVCKKHPTQDHRDKIAASRSGYKDEKHPQWKGKKASYRAKHQWIVRKFGQPSKCEKCGVTGNGHKMHWANKSHKYKRIKEDWIRLCVKCHGKYDSINRKLNS